MPEMSVVRFIESDVIVASLYHLTGASDTIGKNLCVTNPAGDPIFTNYQNGHDATELALDTKFYYSTTTSPYSLNGLVEVDSRDNPDSLTDVDGYYRWFDGAFRYVHQ